MTTRDGMHIKTIVQGKQYALQKRVFVQGRRGRTADEIDDDIDGGYFSWVTVSTHGSFDKALLARERARYGEPLDSGFEAFLAHQTS